MKRLLIGTTNPGKLKELTPIFQKLQSFGIEVVTLENMLKFMKPEETGETFEENAKLKAKYYATKTGLPSIADDGGLIIDTLKGEPGVLSRRWKGGVDETDEVLIEYTLERLKGIPLEQRTARLETCICFFDHEKNLFLCESAHIDGYMAEKTAQNWMEGYPYRALFVVKQFNKYYDELTEEEHAQVNHRRIAAERLCKKIEEHLTQQS